MPKPKTWPSSYPRPALHRMHIPDGFLIGSNPELAIQIIIAL